MDHGQIVAEGTPDALKQEISGDVVNIQLTDSARAAKVLANSDFVRKLETLDDGVRLYVDEAGSAIPQILRVLDGDGIVLGGIELHRPSLDDVFLTKTGRTLRES
jgi:ABC-2 type transport system ATP-binding protein